MKHQHLENILGPAQGYFYAAYELQGYTAESDDRWLLTSGLFGEGSHPMSHVATFNTWQEAKAAANAASNKRPTAVICASQFHTEGWAS